MQQLWSVPAQKITTPPHNHGTVVLSGLAFQTPLNVIIEIVNAIVGVEGVGGWAGGAKESVSNTR